MTGPRRSTLTALAAVATDRTLFDEHGALLVSKAALARALGVSRPALADRLRVMHAAGVVATLRPVVILDLPQLARAAGPHAHETDVDQDPTQRRGHRDGGGTSPLGPAAQQPHGPGNDTGPGRCRDVALWTRLLMSVGNELVDGHPISTATTKLVGRALADHMDRADGSDPGGNARPGLERLAAMTSCSPRSVSYALTALVDAGWLVRLRRGQPGQRAMFAAALPRSVAAANNVSLEPVAGAVELPLSAGDAPPSVGNTPATKPDGRRVSGERSQTAASIGSETRRFGAASGTAVTQSVGPSGEWLQELRPNPTVSLRSVTSGLVEPSGFQEPSGFLASRPKGVSFKPPLTPPPVDPPAAIQPPLMAAVNRRRRATPPAVDNSTPAQVASGGDDDTAFLESVLRAIPSRDRRVCADNDEVRRRLRHLRSGGWTSKRLRDRVSVEMPKELFSPAGFVLSRLAELPDSPPSATPSPAQVLQSTVDPPPGGRTDDAESERVDLTDLDAFVADRQDLIAEARRTLPRSLEGSSRLLRTRVLDVLAARVRDGAEVVPDHITSLLLHATTRRAAS